MAVIAKEIKIEITNMNALDEAERALLEAWVKDQASELEGLACEASETGNSMAMTLARCKLESISDLHSRISGLATALPKAEVLCSAKTDGFIDDDENPAGGGAAVVGRHFVWSPAGMPGCGSRFTETAQYPGDDPEAYTHAIVDDSLEDYLEDRLRAIFSDGPITCRTKGRRMKKGVKLAGGNALFLWGGIDGRSGEFVDGQPVKASPFTVKVWPSKNSNLSQGSLDLDPEQERVIAMCLPRCAGFVESIDPLVVKVYALPSSYGTDGSDLARVAFRFKSGVITRCNLDNRTENAFVKKHPDYLGNASGK